MACLQSVSLALSQACHPCKTSFLILRLIHDSATRKSINVPCLPLLEEFATSIRTLAHAEQFHAKIILTGNQHNALFGAKLVGFYTNCRKLEDARHVFDKIPKPNIVPWNALIKGYAVHGNSEETIGLYHQMRRAGLQPDVFTFPFVLKACAGLADLQQGKNAHDFIRRSGLESNIYVESALVDMYAKCGDLQDACQVFDNMSHRNVVSWTAMIAGYAQNGHAEKALEMFRQMQLAGIKPNNITITSLFPACSALSSALMGKEIHGYVIKSEIDFDEFAKNALLDMYVKCCGMDFARKVFDKMPVQKVGSWTAIIVGYNQNGNCVEALRLFDHMQESRVSPDVVTWDAMISGCAHNGYVNDALYLIRRMQLADVKLTPVTIVSILPLCARLADLQKGIEVHGFIVRRGLGLETCVGNALIDMYAKCGSIEIANRVFHKMPQRDTISWTAIIAGHGMHGHGRNALVLFHQMLEADFKPNHITLVGVLSACSHAGLVEEGWHFFHCMNEEYSITPKVEHYACMVDLLSRAGRLYEAYDFIKRMPIEPGAGVWGALLGACRLYCNIELGELAAEWLFELEPHNSGNYVLLSNIYVESGRWADAGKLRAMMRNKGVKKHPGCSWIEIKKRVHEFLVGDLSHPEAEKIYAMLESLHQLMKAAGYVPDTRFALHDV